MVADTLVYHPTLTHWLKFTSTTVGRDKVLRTIQYFARFYAFYLTRTNAVNESIKTFSTLKSQLGLVRKVLRLGKFLEHFKAAAIAVDAKTLDPIVQYTTVGRQLGYAGYLTFDNAVILDVLGVRKFDGAKRLSQEASRFWATGLIFSILGQLYAQYRLREREARLDRKDGEGVIESKKIIIERAASRLQLLSDCCDLCMPATALGWVTLDDGIVGLAGTVSSIIGVYSQWKKTA